MITIDKYSNRENKFLNLETIVSFNLTEIMTDYEEKLFSSLQQGDYAACEEVLTGFCLDLLDLSDEEQSYVAYVFFMGFITEMIKIQARKKSLQPQNLKKAYTVLLQMKEWETITEYLLNIPTFIDLLINRGVSVPLGLTNNVHVRNALQLICDHLQEKYLNVSWLADQLNISTTHLSNQFKTQVGESVSKYIAKRKVDEIAYEIIHTNKSVKTIRENYGFTNHSYFIQYFKKQKGVTPLQYIRSHL